MQPKPMVLRAVLSVVAPLVAATCFPPSATARQIAQQSASVQTPTPIPNRVALPIDESSLTTLKGNTHPLARPEFDRGVAPASLPLNRMLLVLTRSPQQEAALDALLDQQQDKSSPNYHAWLTPDQFGQQFGPSDQDIQAVTSWLQSRGFTINRVSKGRTVIEFSGNAAQVQQAFHTEMHKYTVDGEDHWANSSDPQIPSTLAPVLAGVATLHDFLKKPQIKISEKRIAAVLQPGSRPQVTFQNGLHALGPWDFYTIYNLTPLIEPPDNGPAAGTGTSIAVVGRSNINVQDVTQFRNIFDQPQNNPQVFVDGPDPGDLGGVDEAEAVLDTTWSGAVAPGANVWLIVSASTNSTDGVDLSEVYIIDNAVGAIMTESFGKCEAAVTAAEATNISQLAEQAAAEGITYIVSAGDTGSAGCDNLSETQAAGPLSVNVLASSPFTVAVGGTQFNENDDNALYWNSTNSQNTLASARSYVPEDVWNETCTAAQCGQNANIAAGGGGASVYFTKPPWQSGVAGIPSDGMRDVPDVALAAAAGHDPYLLCLDGSCQPDAQGNFFFALIGGTSASAPSFAGIIALVNAAVVPLNSHPRLGQINYVLYPLAAHQNPSICNGSSTSVLPSGNCVFNDVTIGNNAVPGEAGYGTTTAAYQSGPGYDLASGLGSVNVANLVKDWSTVSFSSTTTILTVSPTTLTHGTSVNVNVSVAGANGTPSGDVSLFRSGIGSTPLLPASLPVQGNFFTLNASGSVSANTNLLPGGYYSIGAHYAGDGKFGASDSNNVGLTVTPEPSNTVAKALTIDQNGNFIGFTSLPYGSFVYLRSDVTGQSGVGYATGVVNFTDNGANIAGDPYALNSEGYSATPHGLVTVAPGQHSIIANYGGDPDFNPSTSPVVAFNITQAPTATALRFSAAAQGAAFSATVSTNSLGAPPTGTVTFFVGGTQVGSPVGVTGIPATTNPQTGASQGASATVTLTDAQLASGQFTVSATYSGDVNYVASSSVPATITLQPDYSLAASPNLITIPTPGGTGSATLTISPVDGFNGAITFSCSGLPAMSSCQFSPSSVTGSGSTGLTITTTAPTAALVPGYTPGGRYPQLLRCAELFGVILLIGLVCWRYRRRRLLALAGFVLVLGAIGCGGGGGGSTPPPNPGTPTGNYTVSVTATSGTLTHAINVSLSVQ